MNNEIRNLKEDLCVYYEKYIPSSTIEYKEHSVIGLNDLLYETLELNISNNSNEPIKLESIKLYINNNYEIQLKSIGNYEGTYNLNELKLIKYKLDPNMKYITIIIEDNNDNRYKYVTEEIMKEILRRPNYDFYEAP